MRSEQRASQSLCHLTIAATKLTVQLGGPLAYISPVTGEHAQVPALSVGKPLEAMCTLALGEKRQWTKDETGELKDVLDYWTSETKKRNS